jgi:hypothetical protein
VVEEATNSIHPPTGIAIAVLTANASIVLPKTGYTLTALAPLLTTTILLPGIVIVGNTTPELAAAVLITLLSAVKAVPVPWVVPAAEIATFVVYDKFPEESRTLANTPKFLIIDIFYFL